MREEELKYQILNDLQDINLPVDEVDVFFRPYSKTYYGRYFPVYSDRIRPKIYLYPYANKSGIFLEYDTLLSVAIHEFCHHKQYTSGAFVRYKGIMHDEQFWRLYNHYMNRAKKFGIIGGRYEKVI